MFSTCIHCQQDLGRNELIEHLPIGRRLAFDAAAGRMWVICAECGRWNLVPFESRWEAIEEAEKTFRATPLRASTDQVGLARTGEGSELVRIGRPLEPELASWRYGRHFGRRRWRYLGTTVPLIALMTVGANPSLLIDFARLDVHGWTRLATMIGAGLVGSELQARWFWYRTLAALPFPHGTAMISRRILPEVRMVPGTDGEIRLWVPVVEKRIEDQAWFSRLRGVPRLFGDVFRRGEIVHTSLVRPTHFIAVDGDDAAAALRVLLPIVNEDGASRKSLDIALDCLVENGSNARHVAFTGLRAPDVADSTRLSTYGKERRLALEMAVHADSERRWLEGEMAALMEEWRRANEIATIADTLIADPDIERRLAALRVDAASDSVTS